MKAKHGHAYRNADAAEPRIPATSSIRINRKVEREEELAALSA